MFDRLLIRDFGALFLAFSRAARRSPRSYLPGFSRPSARLLGLPLVWAPPAPKMAPRARWRRLRLPWPATPPHRATKGPNRPSWGRPRAPSRQTRAPRARQAAPASPLCGDRGAEGGSQNSAPASATPHANEPSYPATWAEITVGSIVLAHATPTEGWWEAVVLEAKGNLIKLEWRDFPEDGPFVRRRHKLGLMLPNQKTVRI